MSKLAQVAAATNGVIVPVDVPATASAYAALDANPCSPAAANGVVSAINDLVDKVRSDNGGLKGLRTIQIVGSDRDIPQARVLDQTVLAHESDYASEAAIGNVDNPVSRAQREGYVLSDDPFGDFDPGMELYVPDVALGRLIESAKQMADQLEAFNASNGYVAPSRTFVTGYDFVSDGAQKTFDALNSRTTGQLLLENWTANQARDGLNGTSVFGSVNGHYDHSRALPGAPGDRLLGANEVTPAAGSIIFTVGCHAGLNLSVTGDWADQMASRAVLYAANTGYGYGDSEAVAYSETLMADYARQLVSGDVTAGQALMFAKQRTAAGLATSDDYWNKSLMEATFYGLAMTKVGQNGSEAPSALPRDLTGQANAVRASSTYNIHPAFTRHDEDRGSFWSADGFDPLVIQNRPIQPRTTIDVTPDDQAPVHGAMIESLTSQEIAGINHVISRPMVDDSSHEEEPDAATTFFPAQLIGTQPVQTAAGAKEQLTLNAGQARQDVQRLLTDVNVRVFRSRSADYDPNTITRVDGLVQNGAYSISVDVTGGGEDGGRVLFRTDAGNAWNSVPLAVISSGRLGAGGALPAGATQITETMVFVYDVNGNVAFSNRKVVGYSFQPIPLVAGEPKLTLSPAPPASGYYTAPPTVALDPGNHTGANFEYSIDNGGWQAYSAPFTVNAPTEGEHIVRVRASDGSSAFNRFAVDTQGPSVTASATTAPNAQGWYTGPVTVHFDCADAVSGVASCPADKTISTEGANQSATGTATDRAGQSGSGGVDGINIDSTKPTITVATTATKNADGWYKQPVTFTFTCNDALSGVKSCPAPVTVDEGKNQTVTGQTEDKAGNTASVTVTDVNVDKTPPTLTATPNKTEVNGWFNEPVTYTFTCTDATSLIKGTCPAPITQGETTGKAISASVSDFAGNTTTFSKTVKVDVTKPTTKINTGLVSIGNVTGTASDADSTAPVVISGVGVVTVTYTSGATTKGPYTASLSNCTSNKSSCNWSTPSPGFGVWNVKAQTTDVAGGVGPAATGTISLG
jgi:hypothetical protein